MIDHLDFVNEYPVYNMESIRTMHNTITQLSPSLYIYIYITQFWEIFEQIYT
jgi:hypothetical protein